MAEDTLRTVLITGAAGSIGTALAEALSGDYRVVGLDLKASEEPFPIIEFDLTNDASVELALGKLRERFGSQIASVVHLAAYFDFTGEESPLYGKVNEEGTRRLLRHLQGLEVEQFVYSSTMLVHAAGRPGDVINEDTPLDPQWAYPKSKTRTEEIIRAEHGDIPCVILRFAGIYDNETTVPTLAHQIAHIYERDVKSHLFPADPRTGQAFVHMDDAIDALRRTIDRRGELAPEATVLVGEPAAPAYEDLQDEIGQLIHGAEEWGTLRVPQPLAKAGAWLETRSEPLVPDAFDQGEPPFERPFMVSLADQHYELDVSRAGTLLGWQPRHRLVQTLPEIVHALQSDPLGWYRKHGITPPPWLESAEGKVANPEALRRAHEFRYRHEHRRNIWSGFITIGLGSWLATSPPILGYASQALAWSDFVAGLLVVALGCATLSWRLWPARWAVAVVGLWLLFAPLVFWAPTAASYLNDTIVGALLIGFALALKPAPGVARAAEMTGPVVPPGWDYSPSGWFQRIPIIVLAFVGLYISRYLAAYQLGHIDGVWEPFFPGDARPTNGTEQIITSPVSEAWPVPDAGIGALTYMLEIVTGLIGSSRRWRTMPWLVVLFGILIVPLGVVSITFIVIQPIVIGTWCTLCLIAAAAMLLQIPYSLDELLATGQFLYRRKKAGRSLLRVFLLGDTDEGGRDETDEFERSPTVIVKDMLSGGITMQWSLLLSIAIGVWLMFSRVTVDAAGAQANADHLIGSLVITVSVTALAEMARPIRFLNIVFALALFVTPFIYDAGLAALVSSLVCGCALIALSIPRGPIRNSYGAWSHALV